MKRTEMRWKIIISNVEISVELLLELEWNFLDQNVIEVEFELGTWR